MSIEGIFPDQAVTVNMKGVVDRRFYGKNVLLFAYRVGPVPIDPVIFGLRVGAVPSLQYQVSFCCVSSHCNSHPDPSGRSDGLGFVRRALN